MRRHALRAVPSLSLAALLSTLALLHGCASLSGRIASAVYPGLDQPWDPENAPTAATFPESADIRAVIGGRGEGIGCSIPPLAESLMFTTGPKEPAVTLAFRQACVFHDFCYRHGHATYGYAKSDCDTLLQEHAYRVCLQIYGSTLGREECRARARVVLLGVNLFGGTNFAHGHKSTFFEFDPFPRRANDYVVARLVAHRDVPGEDIDPDSEGRDRSLWTFYFKEGWMMVRDRRFRLPCKDPVHGDRSSCERERASAGVPFLREKVPVPPQIVHTGEGDRFVWLARRGLVNTGVYVLAADATSAWQMARALSGATANAGTQDTKCANVDSKNARGGPTAALEFDCDAGLSRVVAVDCPPGGWRTVVVAEGGLQLSDDPCDANRTEIGLISHRMRGAGASNSPYRLAQDEFVVGDFGSGRRLDIVTLGRGLTLDSANGFRNQVVASRRTLSGQQTPSRAELNFSEAFEPVAPYRDDGAAQDRLIAPHAACLDPAKCSVRVGVWTPASHWEDAKAWRFDDTTLLDDIGRPVGIDWLRQPAHVLSPASPGKSDWLVLSHVDSSTVGHSLDDDLFTPLAVKLEYRAFRLSNGIWQDSAHACVQIDLRKQIASSVPSVLSNRYFPTDTVKGERDACIDSGTPAPAAIIPACRAMLRDVASRWHRSQVIPGFIAKPPAGDRRERTPDAVFVFNGFPGYAVMVRGDSWPDKPWASACKGGS